MFGEKEQFYKNVYQKECDTKVITCKKLDKGYEVILEKTIFYPEGGGQSCDLGKIQDAEVIDVRRIDDKIVHYVKTPLIENTNVHCVIDWKRRYDHMQNHTGEHLLSGIIHKLYGLENVGFHMDEEKIQADYDGVLNKEDIKKIEKEVNEVIHKNLPVSEWYPKEEELENLNYRSKKELKGKVRIIAIEDVDVCACCGTHVSSTAEVNLMKIIHFEKHKTGTRIEMLCGQRALEDYSFKHEQNTILYQEFSVKPYEVSKAVEKLNASYLSLQKEYMEICEKYLEEKTNQFTNEEDYILDILDFNVNNIVLRNYANVLSKKSDLVLVLNRKEETGYQYVFVSNKEDVREICKQINKELNGKGGGKEHFAQGSIHAGSKEISEKIKKIFQERKEANE